jgi:hypothetical protein
MTKYSLQHLDPVLAHSLLGSVAAVKGALDTVMAHELDGTSRDSLLLMASRRLDHIAEQLRQLALGLSDDELWFAEMLLPQGTELNE